MKIRFELKAVTKFYIKKSSSGKPSPFAVLDGVDLKIYDNKINAIVGKSGCGKSTLARVLMRLEDYDSGEILYKEKKIESTPEKEFRRKNQIMFQNPLLSVNSHFKIKKIISEPLLIEKRDKKEIGERIDYLLDILEIPQNLLDRLPKELSAGQLQRVVLVRALILKPEFVVLDEPFSSLDEIMAVRLMTHFKKIFSQLNIGVLYISHHLERVKFFADTVFFMTQREVNLYP
jgi:ABC-type glutathione transport system ATPase component